MFFTFKHDSCSRIWIHCTEHPSVAMISKNDVSIGILSTFIETNDVFSFSHLLNILKYFFLNSKSVSVVLSIMFFIDTLKIGLRNQIICLFFNYLPER